MHSTDAIRAPQPDAALALRVAGLAFAGVVLSLAWTLGGGVRGCIYVGLYCLTAAPGLPVGFLLFGRNHAAGWIGGAVIGYALSAFALWLPAQLHVSGPLAPAISWFAVTLLSACLLRIAAPVVPLPSWKRGDTLALVLVLFAVPALVWSPFTNIGAMDEEDSRRYRAYFTADFLWHVALSAELARGDSPPRNPYLASKPLNYYWTYFVVPAVVSRTGLLPFTRDYLTLNATCAGLVFVSMIFIFAWLTIPRAGPAAIATLLSLLAASAEGVHATWTLWQRNEALEGLRHLNIDAITAWFLRGLTIDGLPRSLWYTPQHAASCALGLTGLAVAAYAPARRPLAGLAAGLSLGLALIVSPFLGGAFSLVYGFTSLAAALRHRSDRIGSLFSTVPAVLPVMLALGWCVASGTFEGARGSIAIGLSRAAMAAPLLVPALALGPLLVIAIPALALGRRHRIDGAVAGAVVGFGLFYFVTLTAEPIWIGWRAGQILLVTLPGLAAVTIAELNGRDWTRGVIRFAVALAFLVGVPTAAIDLHNAQDIETNAMGPGFRWTVVVHSDTHAAMEWIRNNTPRRAIVQMCIGPRGRETWTLIPTFAERRMAAGQPISLLRIPEYERQSAQADAMFRTTDAAEAARIARSLAIDYVYVGRVERQAFGDAAAAKFRDARYFNEVFSEGLAAVYQVR